MSCFIFVDFASLVTRFAITVISIILYLYAFWSVVLCLPQKIHWMHLRPAIRWARFKFLIYQHLTCNRFHSYTDLVSFQWRYSRLCKTQPFHHLYPSSISPWSSQYLKVIMLYARSTRCWLPAYRRRLSDSRKHTYCDASILPPSSFQILNYFDYFFTSVFTVEITLKVSESLFCKHHACD